MKRLGEISDTFHYSLEEKEALVEVAMTTLSSKIVNRSHRPMAEIAVDAVLAVADIERKDVNLDLIKMDGKVGGRLEDTKLVRGIVIDKDMSHPQMVKDIKDAKLCVLTCAADVLLQPLVDRRLMEPRALPVLLGVSVVPACVFALPVLAEHVSWHGAVFSFALWWGREHRALSNLAIVMIFTEVLDLLTDSFGWHFVITSTDVQLSHFKAPYSALMLVTLFVSLFCLRQVFTAVMGRRRRPPRSVVRTDASLPARRNDFYRGRPCHNARAALSRRHCAPTSCRRRMCRR